MWMPDARQACKVRSRPSRTGWDHGMLVRFVRSFATTQRPKVAAASLSCGPKPDSLPPDIIQVTHGALRFLFWARCSLVQSQIGLLCVLRAFLLRCGVKRRRHKHESPLAAPNPCLKRRQLAPHRPFAATPASSGKRYINQACQGTTQHLEG